MESDQTYYQLTGSYVPLFKITIDKEEIKEYEKGIQEEKEKRCREIYSETIGDMDRVIPYEKAWNPKWMNKTMTEAKIKMEIAFLRDRVDAELKTINATMSPYVFEMKEEYLKDFDLNAAMALKNKLEENQKKKELFEQEEKLREQERLRAIEEKARRVQEAGTAPVPEAVKAERVISVTFRVIAKESQFNALNEAINALKANSEKVEIIDRKEMNQ